MSRLIIRDENEHECRILRIENTPAPQYVVAFLNGKTRTLPASFVDDAKVMAVVRGSVSAKVVYTTVSADNDTVDRWSVEWVRDGFEVLRSAADLRRFAAVHGLRNDWHEPDEQGLTVEVVGRSFDNAIGAPVGEDLEMGVYLSKNGDRIAWINLATLFALATRNVDIV